MSFAIALLAVAALIVLGPVLGVLLGMLAGLIVGLIVGPTIMGVLTAILPEAGALELWQIGGFLGFIGGFFKSTTTVNKG